MSEDLSIVIFGPNDGFVEYAIPNAEKLPSESFAINSNDFQFNSNGLILQFARTGPDDLWISIHQQIKEKLSTRDGYCFGLGIYGPYCNLTTENITRLIFQIHDHLKSSCLTSDGRFDGLQLETAIKPQLNLRYKELFKAFAAEANASEYFLPTAKLVKREGLITIKDATNVEDVNRCVNWFRYGLAGRGYSRLIIKDGNSGSADSRFIELKSFDNEERRHIRAEFDRLLIQIRELSQQSANKDQIISQANSSLFQKQKELDLLNEKLNSEAREINELSIKNSNFLSQIRGLEIARSNQSVGFPQGNPLNPQKGVALNQDYLTTLSKRIESYRFSVSDGFDSLQTTVLKCNRTISDLEKAVQTEKTEVWRVVTHGENVLTQVINFKYWYFATAFITACLILLSSFFVNSSVNEVKNSRTYSPDGDINKQVLSELGDLKALLKSRASVQEIPVTGGSPQSPEKSKPTHGK